MLAAGAEVSAEVVATADQDPLPGEVVKLKGSHDQEAPMREILRLGGSILHLMEAVQERDPLLHAEAKSRQSKAIIVIALKRLAEALQQEGTMKALMLQMAVTAALALGMTGAQWMMMMNEDPLHEAVNLLECKVKKRKQSRNDRCNIRRFAV